jgi:hypothetical protein
MLVILLNGFLLFWRTATWASRLQKNVTGESCWRPKFAFEWAEIVRKLAMRLRKAGMMFIKSTVEEA